MNIPFCSGLDEMNSSVSSCTTPFHCLPLRSGFWSRQDSFRAHLHSRDYWYQSDPSEQMLKPVSAQVLSFSPSPASVSFPGQCRTFLWRSYIQPMSPWIPLVTWIPWRWLSYHHTLWAAGGNEPMCPHYTSMCTWAHTHTYIHTQHINRQM